jgi:transposase-like protein
MAGDKVKTPWSGSLNAKDESRHSLPMMKEPTLLGMVREHVLPKSTVFTDELNAYHGISHKPHRSYDPKRINHSAKVYVVGEIHTNTVEGFWSLLKNGLRGVYHSVGKTYLQSYLNEYSFRYNRRFDAQPMFLSFLQLREARRCCPSIARSVEPF